MNYFPLFVSLEGKTALAVGGGRIAERRISALLNFGCRIRVISPELTPVLSRYSGEGRIEWNSRRYQTGDCRGADIVLAMTMDETVNRAVWEDCKREGITVNVADRKELCDFYFPGIVIAEEAVIGVIANGGNHRLASELTGKIREEYGSRAAEKEASQ